MAQVFISYAREDRDIAAKLAAALSTRGLDVWWDRDLLAGREFDRAIEEELRRAHAVVVLWSPASIASRWVRAEAAVAAERDAMVPVTIRDARPPLQFHNIQGVDLAGWDGAATSEPIVELERAIGALAGTGAAFVAPSGAPVATPRPLVRPPPSPPAPVASAPLPPGRPRRRVPRMAIAVVAALLAVGGVVTAVVVSGADDAPTSPTTAGPITTSDGADATEPAPPDTATGCAVELRRGCGGDTVHTLQTLLIAVGLDPGTPDGDFGRLTEAALIEFEKANKLEPNGRINPAGDEWNKLVLAASRATTTSSATTASKTTAPNTTTPVAPPTLLSPPDKATLNNSPRVLPLKWAATASATAYHVDVQYNDGQWKDLSNALKRDCAPATITATTCTVEFVGAQPGRWRVAAILNDGTQRTSDWREFRYSV